MKEHIQVTHGKLKIIDALLIQPLSHKQLLAFCKMNYYTARDALQTLSSNKLIEKNGEVYSLRRI